MPPTCQRTSARAGSGRRGPRRPAAPGWRGGCDDAARSRPRRSRPGPTHGRGNMNRNLNRTLKVSSILVALLHPLACAPGDEGAVTRPAAMHAPHFGAPVAEQAPEATAPTTQAPEGPASPSQEDGTDQGAPPNNGHGIDYNGGPVMGGTVNIYYIWYGNW